MPATRSLTLAVLLLLVCVLVVPRGMTPARAASTAANAVVLAADGTLLAPGPAVSLPVQVKDVQQLGAATVLVSYDPAQVQATACQRSAGFDIGLCNIHYDRDHDGVADGVLFNAVSIQGVTAGAAPVALANITWQAAAGVQPPASAVLAVQVQTFTDVNANPLAVTPQDGHLTILVGPTFTPTPTATPTRTLTPTSTATSAFRRVYMPLLRRSGQPEPSATPTLGEPAVRTRTPTPTATRTPTLSALPVFTCSNWCTTGSAPNTRKQSVSADRPVSDWRAVIDFALLEALTVESATSAEVEAPNDASVRVEALFGGQWLVACKSVASCVP
jgi:hypothetical protein